MPQTRSKWKSHLINYTFNWGGESGAFMLFCYVQYGFLEPKLFSRLVSPPFGLEAPSTIVKPGLKIGSPGSNWWSEQTTEQRGYFNRIPL